MEKSVHLVLIHPSQRRKLLPLIETLVRPLPIFIHVSFELSPLAFWPEISASYSRLKSGNKRPWSELGPDEKFYAVVAHLSLRLDQTINLGIEPQGIVVDRFVDAFITAFNRRLNLPGRKGGSSIRVVLEPQEFELAKACAEFEKNLRLLVTLSHIRGKDTSESIVLRSESLVETYVDLAKRRSRLFVDSFVSKYDPSKTHIIIRDPWGIGIEYMLLSKSIGVQSHRFFEHPLDPLNGAVFVAQRSPVPCSLFGERLIVALRT